MKKKVSTCCSSNYDMVFGPNGANAYFCRNCDEECDVEEIEDEK